MHVKVFHAFTMQEAIHAIKAELGPDAVILSTKDVRQRGTIAKWFGRPLIEVTAAIDRRATAPGTNPTQTEHEPPAMPREAPPDPSVVPYSRFEETLRGLVHDAPAPKLTASPPASPASKAITPLRPGAPPSPQLTRVRAELRGLHQHLLETYPEDAIATPKHIPGQMTALYRDFVTRSVAPQTAASFVQRLHDRVSGEHLRDMSRLRPVLRELVKREMAEGIPVLTAQDDRKIAVLFGPSGAGKTTVIAKLAAHYRTEQGRSVALMTMDTYRTAAVEQLRGYAHALDIPLEAALTKQDALECINRFSHADVILVDTGGRSAADSGLLNDIRWLTTLDHVVETHLVLSATTREEDLLTTVRRCGECPVRRLLFTKLDETTGVGSLLTVHKQTGIPFSYFGTGPRVPYDLEVASAGRLADALLDGALREEGAGLGRISKIVSESMGLEPARVSAY